MGSIDRRSCFLTRVGGQLSGNGERIEVYSGTSTSWRLAAARCISRARQGPMRRLWAATSSSTAILLYGLGRLRARLGGSDSPHRGRAISLEFAAASRAATRSSRFSRRMASGT